MNALRAFALEVATKAAQNIGGTIREVAKRTKSQAYLFGSLRRRFPESAEDDIRQALYWLRHDAPDQDFAPTPRKPTKGREPSSEPCWATRAGQLASVIECSSPEELIEQAARSLGWARNFTIQTLAAAEDAGLLTYEAYCWARSDNVTKAKITTIRIERTLPCKLTPEQSHKAAQAAAAKLLERERLEAELKSVTRELRVKIADCQKEFIRLVVASGQALEDRAVPCEQKINYKLGTCEVIRLDTGDLIEARELTQQEKQMPLELGATG